MDEQRVTRARIVVNTYRPLKDSDEFIENSFNESVAIAIEEIEEDAGEIVMITFDHKAVDDLLVLTSNIEYCVPAGSDTEDDDFEAEDDEPEEDYVPEVGTDPSHKVTAEVFDFVHEKYDDEGMSVLEIVGLFEGKLSRTTVTKILNTESFEEYYK